MKPSIFFLFVEGGCQFFAYNYVSSEVRSVFLSFGCRYIQEMRGGLTTL